MNKNSAKTLLYLSLILALSAAPAAATHLDFGASYEYEGTGDALADYPGSSSHRLSFTMQGFVGESWGFFYDLSELVTVHHEYWNGSELMLQPLDFSTVAIFGYQFSALFGAGYQFGSDGVSLLLGLGLAFEHFTPLTLNPQFLLPYSIGAGAHVGLAFELNPHIALTFSLRGNYFPFSRGAFAFLPLAPPAAAVMALGGIRFLL